MDLPSRTDDLPETLGNPTTEIEPPGRPQDRDRLPAIPDHELIRRVGRGAYGEVWLARNILGTYRAVKIVFRDSFHSDQPYEREFRGIQRFEPVSRTNDGLMDILQVGRNDGLGCFYYVMELSDDAEEQSSALIDPKPDDKISVLPYSGAPAVGHPDTYSPKTLGSEIRRQGRLPAADCVQLGLALTSALSHLHRHGLIHRDIKPSNIIYVHGVPKLADIGLVAEVEEALSFVGTEGFIPPEGPTSPQADLYSVGKVLYEASMGKDRKQFPEPMTGLRDLKDPMEQQMLLELNAIILKACAEDVRDRYQSAEEFHADLALLQSGKSIRRRRRLELQLARLTKVSVAGAALTLLVTSGYFYQQHQTGAAKRLAFQLQLNHGFRLLDDDDHTGALLWFAEALRDGDSYLTAEERARHQLRLGVLLQECPKLTQVIVPELVDGTATEDSGWAEFSPDNRRILISGYGRTVFISDAATGEIIHRLQHRANVWKSRFSSDGRRLLTILRQEGVFGEAQVWDAETGQRIGSALTHFDQSRSQRIDAVMSQDGRRVVTFSGTEAQIWDAETGRKISPLLRANKPIAGASFVADSERVFAQSFDGSIHLWNPLTGQPSEAPLNFDGDRADFNANVSRVLTRSADAFKLWDMTTAKQLLTIPWSGRGAGTIAPGGHWFVLTGTDDGTIQVHDALTGAQVGPTIKQPGGCAYAVISSDGRRVASFRANRLKVWDVKTGRPVITPIWCNDFHRAAFSSDGSLLVTAGGGIDPVIRVWNLNAAESQRLPMQHGRTVFHAAFSPDDRRIVTASEDETARVWDGVSATPIGAPLHTNHITDHSLFAHIDRPWERLVHPITGERVRSVASGLAHTNTAFHPVLGDKLGPTERLQSTNRAVFFAVFSPDSRRIATTSYDGTIRIWDPSSGRELLQPLKHRGAVFHATFSRDNRWIATASADWTAQIWDLETGEPAGPLLQHQGAVLHVDFSPDGRLVVTASYDMSAQVWDAQTGAKIGPPLMHWNRDHGPVFTANFSPDSKRVVTASYDRTAQVWDAITGHKITPALRHRDFVFYADFSPDGKVIVTASRDHTAQLWDAVTGAKATPPLQHGAEVNRAVFSADGRWLVTASLDGTARVWDTATGQPLTPPLNHHDKVWHAEFSSDGRRVVTASSDGTARLWHLSPINWPGADLQLLAQSLAGRQIDHTGSLAPVMPHALKDNWQKLRSRHSNWFRTNQAEIGAR